MSSITTQCIALVTKYQRCTIQTDGDLCLDCHDRFHAIYQNYKPTEDQFTEFICRDARPKLWEIVSRLNELLVKRKEFLNHLADLPTLIDKSFIFTKLLTALYIYQLQLKSVGEYNGASTISVYVSRLVFDPFQRLVLLQTKNIVERWLRKNNLFIGDYITSLNNLDSNSMCTLWNQKSKELWYGNQNDLCAAIRISSSTLCGWKSRSGGNNRSKVLPALRDYLLLSECQQTFFATHDVYNLIEALPNMLVNYEKLLILDKFRGVTDIDRVIDKSRNTLIILFSEISVATNELEHLYGSLLVVNTSGMQSNNDSYYRIMYIISHCSMNLDVTLLAGLDCINHIHEHLRFIKPCTYFTYEDTEYVEEDTDVNQYLL